MCEVLSRGGGLASIHSYEENDFITGLIDAEGVGTAWIGMYYDQKGKLGETSKFNFCDPSFPHSLTTSNYIVCDFCRCLTELSWLSI